MPSSLTPAQALAHLPEIHRRLEDRGFRAVVRFSGAGDLSIFLPGSVWMSAAAPLDAVNLNMDIIRCSDALTAGRVRFEVQADGILRIASWTTLGWPHTPRRGVPNDPPVQDFKIIDAAFPSIAAAVEAVLDAPLPGDLGGRADVVVFKGVPAHLRFRLENGGVLATASPSRGQRQSVRKAGHGPILNLSFYTPDGKWLSGASVTLKPPLASLGPWKAQNAYNGSDFSACVTETDVAAVLIRTALGRAIKNTDSAHQRAALAHLLRTSLARLEQEGLMPLAPFDGDDDALALGLLPLPWVLDGGRPTLAEQISGGLTPGILNAGSASEDAT